MREQARSRRRNQSIAAHHRQRFLKQLAVNLGYLLLAGILGYVILSGVSK